MSQLPKGSMQNSEQNSQGLIIAVLSASHNNEAAHVNHALTCATCGGPSSRKYCGIACYRIWQRSRPADGRFWEKVNKRGPQTSTAEGNCWDWTSNKVGRPGFLYGQFCHNGANVYAHRYAYEREHGPIPAGVEILHACDRPICVRASHLRLGTHAENLRDAADKGRFNVPRPNHHRLKLTQAQVEEIRNLFANNARQVDLAARFGVTKGCINQIVHRTRRVYTAPQFAVSKERTA